MALREITDVSNISDAVGQAVRRLARLAPDERVRLLLDRGRKLEGQVNRWKVVPPSSGDKYEAMGEMLRFIADAAGTLEADGMPESGDKGERTSSVPPPTSSQPARASSSAPAPTSSPAAPGRPSASKADGPGLDVRRTWLERWRELRGHAGVRAKALHIEPVAVVLLRFEPGGELRIDAEALSEVLYVLDGSLTIDEVEVAAGSSVILDPARQSVGSPGESTALLIGTSRALIAAS